MTVLRRAAAAAFLTVMLAAAFAAPPARAQSAPAPEARPLQLAGADRCECHWWARDDAETPCPPKSKLCFKFIGSALMNVCERRKGICRPAGTQD